MLGCAEVDVFSVASASDGRTIAEDECADMTDGDKLPISHICTEYETVARALRNPPPSPPLLSAWSLSRATFSWDS